MSMYSLNSSLDSLKWYMSFIYTNPILTFFVGLPGLEPGTFTPDSYRDSVALLVRTFSDSIFCGPAWTRTRDLYIISVTL